MEMGDHDGIDLRCIDAAGGQVTYLSALAPACEMRSSLPPELPMAPMNLPSTTRGTPPAEATAPASAMGDKSPAATRSKNVLVERRHSAAEGALSCALLMDAYCVPSMLRKKTRAPAGSTTGIAINILCVFASAPAASAAFMACAS